MACVILCWMVKEALSDKETLEQNPEGRDQALWISLRREFQVNAKTLRDLSLHSLGTTEEPVWWQGHEPGEQGSGAGNILGIWEAWRLPEGIGFDCERDGTPREVLIRKVVSAGFPIKSTFLLVPWGIEYRDKGGNKTSFCLLQKSQNYKSSQCLAGIKNDRVEISNLKRRKKQFVVTFWKIYNFKCLGNLWGPERLSIFSQKVVRTRENKHRTEIPTCACL